MNAVHRRKLGTCSFRAGPVEPFRRRALIVVGALRRAVSAAR
ncbi:MULTISPECIES: hypothetical protein [unclassified Streptomyces]|nr:MULTISPECIES: hypothetical protein [unclassified Streptomyces]